MYSNHSPQDRCHAQVEQDPGRDPLDAAAQARSSRTACTPAMPCQVTQTSSRASTTSTTGLRIQAITWS